MPFVPFAGMTLTARRISKRNKQDVDLAGLLVETAQVMTAMHRWPDVFQAAIEHQHYFESHRVLLVTRELSEALYSSKIDFCLKYLRLPYSICEICFEQGLKVPGTNIQAPGTLVVAKPSQASMDAMDRFMKKAAGNGLDMESYRNIFSMRYVMDDETLPEGMNSTYAMNIDLTKNGEMEIEDVIRKAPDMEHVDATLNDEEKKNQAAIMKLVIGALCYLSIDNAEKEDAKVFDRPRMGVKPSCLILGKNYKEIARHMRKGHIRRLRHEKYKRDEDGNVRMVWVHEHEVGGAAEHLMEAKKELMG